MRNLENFCKILETKHYLNPGASNWHEGWIAIPTQTSFPCLHKTEQTLDHGRQAALAGWATASICDADVWVRVGRRGAAGSALVAAARTGKITTDWFF